jgi:hypothetical protein
MGELSTVLEQAFDTANEEGSPDFEPIPKGSYVASITEAKVGPLKSGKGQAVSLTWQIDGGPYACRLVFDRAIVSHESAKAQEIGRRHLKDIASACGVNDAITDLSVLLNKPCLVFVKIETDETGEYSPKNRVGRVKRIEDPKKADGKVPFNDKVDF